MLEEGGGGGGGGGATGLLNKGGGAKGFALSQGLICTKRVHLGHSKVAFIEGVSSRQGWPLQARGSTVEPAANISYEVVNFIIHFQWWG